MAGFVRYRTKAAAYAIGEMPHEPKVALTPGSTSVAAQICDAAYEALVEGRLLTRSNARLCSADAVGRA